MSAMRYVCVCVCVCVCTRACVRMPVSILMRKYRLVCVCKCVSTCALYTIALRHRYYSTNNCVYLALLLIFYNPSVVGSFSPPSGSRSTELCQQQSKVLGEFCHNSPKPHLMVILHPCACSFASALHIQTRKHAH